MLDQSAKFSGQGRANGVGRGRAGQVSQGVRDRTEAGREPGPGFRGKRRGGGGNGGRVLEAHPRQAVFEFALVLPDLDQGLGHSFGEARNLGLQLLSVWDRGHHVTTSLASSSEPGAEAGGPSG